MVTNIELTIALDSYQNLSIFLRPAEFGFAADLWLNPSPRRLG